MAQNRDLVMAELNNNRFKYEYQKKWIIYWNNIFCILFLSNIFFTYKRAPDNSMDYPIFYFSLNLYKSMSIASREVAILIQLVFCVISWLVVWGGGIILYKSIKK